MSEAVECTSQRTQACCLYLCSTIFLGIGTATAGLSVVVGGGMEWYGYFIGVGLGVFGVEMLTLHHAWMYDGYCRSFWGWIKNDEYSNPPLGPWKDDLEDRGVFKSDYDE